MSGAGVLQPQRQVFGKTASNEYLECRYVVELADQYALAFARPVCAHRPVAKDRGCRSSVQPFASTAAALSPLIRSATWPPDRTFGDACMPLSASSSNAGAVAEGLGGSENGHWRENGAKRLDFQGGAPDAERIPGCAECKVVSTAFQWRWV